MNDVAHMLLGAALVAMGVFAAALADRIRRLRITRERASAVGATRASIEAVDPETIPKSERARASHSLSKTQRTASDAVIAALVGAGHKRQAATEAVWDCPAAERATIEQWTLSALRRCALGGIS